MKVGYSKFICMVMNFLFAIKKKLFWQKGELMMLEEYLKALPLVREKSNRGVVLIDVPDNANELAEQLAFARYFASQGLQPKIYYPSIHARTGGKFLLDFVGGLFQRYSRGVRFALKNGIDKGLDHSEVSTSIRNKAMVEAVNLRDSLKLKTDLLDCKIEGVALGVAVYDTYLRLYSRPTVDLESPQLLKLIYQAYVIFYTIKAYFDKNAVCAVVLGHAVYNNWKILSDYAVAQGVDVYVTYNSRFAPLHHVNTHRGLQTIDHSRYKAIFASYPISNQEIYREMGRQFMAKRMAGHLDEGLSYMASSAYGQVSECDSEIPLQLGKRPLVIMLHSFFDSPHIYKDMIFEDFLAWCNGTLEYFNEKGLAEKYQLMLKPHPNRIEGEDEIIDKIASRFSFVTRLSGRESNRWIIEINPAAIITVYGTVAAEFAFAGIPVITCGDNPTSSFAFCFQASSSDEYFHLIDEAHRLTVTKAMQNEVGEYAYMHYMQSPRVSFNNYPFKRYQRASDTGCFVSRVIDFNYDKFTKIVDHAIVA